MKIKKIEYIGNLPVYNTNVNNNGNYISENGVIHKNCVVDEDYRGEIHLHVRNVSSSDTTIKKGQKLVQFILIHINLETIECINEEEFNNEPTERGDGAFGSTGIF